MATIHIESGKSSNFKSKSQSKIQYMPCKINTDCKANISSYFANFVKTDKNSDCSVSYRGHLLMGKKIHVPGGYRGLVLQEHVKSEIEREDRKFFISHDFDCVYYWKVPGDNDTILQVLNDWIDVAEALHAPITN